MEWTSKDWLKWVAAGFALVATASAEYELARAIGMNEFIAAAVPGALDAYVVRALRAHREVLTAVLAMVGVNAASHLVTAGIMPVDWRLITAVSAIAPLVLWRVHALGTPGEWRARTIWGVPEREENTGVVTSEWDEHMKDVPGLPPLPVRVPGGLVTDTQKHGDECPCLACDGVPDWVKPPLSLVPQLPADWGREERQVRTHLNSERVQERFWDKVSVPDPETGCMAWTSNKNEEGYGRFSVAGTNHPAHRVAYEIAEGSVPEGLVLDHLCRTPECVRPDHLEPVTHAENVRRGWQSRKEQGPVLRNEAAPSRSFPEILAEARDVYPAGVPTVREVKARLRVGTGNAQKVVEALKNGVGADADRS